MSALCPRIVVGPSRVRLFEAAQESASVRLKELTLAKLVGPTGRV
jgi:hypothetical protein